MDSNKFFRAATLRICGNLEIEEGLQSCMEHLTGTMPVDRMILEHYDKDFDSMRKRRQRKNIKQN